MKELLKNFFIYGFGGILSKLVFFLLLPILTKQLTPAEYGYFDLIFTISSIASIFGMLSLETGFQRQFYLQSSDKERDVLISTILYAIVIFSAIVAAIVFFSIPLLSRIWFSGGFTKEIGVACIEILATNIVLYMQCVMRYDDKPKIYAVISVVSALLNAGLSIFFVVVLSMGVMGALLGSILSQCIISLVLLFIERKHLCIAFNKQMFKAVAAFAFPMLPARIGSVANTYANRFLMITLFSAEMIGLYALSVKLASAMTLVHTAFQFAWTPYLYKILNQEGHKPIIVEVFRQSLFVIALIVIVISLFSKELVTLVSNEQYVEASSIVGLLCLYNGLFLVKESTEIGVKVTGKSVYVTYAYFGSVAVNLLFLAILPRMLGLVGIALALLCSAIFLLYVTIYFSNRLYKIDFPLGLLTLVICITVSISLYQAYFDMPLIFKFFISVLLLFAWIIVLLPRFKKLISGFKNRIK